LSDFGTELCPYRVAYWFDDRPDTDYIELNQRFWHLYRTVARDVKWKSTPITSVPFIAVWFGRILSARLAMSKVAYPTAWCIVLGASSRAIATEAQRLIENQQPVGLIRTDRTVPDPSRYSLPLVGLLMPGTFLSFEVGSPRYEHLLGYEVITPEDETAATIIDQLGATEAERLILRALAFSVARRIEGPDRSSYSSLVDHARELWALGADQAVGIVGGTALELLLRKSLVARNPTVGKRAQKATLGPLVSLCGKHLPLTKPGTAWLDTHRKLRNDCAHSVSSSATTVSAAPQLRDRVDQFISWLERQTDVDVDALIRAIDLAGSPSAPPTMEAALDTAFAAARIAAEAITPNPMVVVTAGSRYVLPSGSLGFAWILVRKPSKEVRHWLEGKFHVEAQRRKHVVRIFIARPDQSAERAGAFAREFTDRIKKVGVDASYEPHLD
jgi:hypothetical protein